jgi:hypothetical protein
VKKFIPCSRCDKLTPGYIKIPSPSLSAGYILVRCSCLLEWKEKVKLEASCKKAHLRPSVYEGIYENKVYDPLKDYLGEKSSSNMLKLVKYVNEFNLKYSHQSLYLYGPHSTQKTTLAQWVAFELLKKGKKVQYLLMRTLIEFLLSRGWEEKEQRFLSDHDYSNFSQIADADVLVIDEAFDPQKITIYKSSYQIPYLDQFLRERIDVLEKPVIFVSNINPTTELQKAFPSLKDLEQLIYRRIVKRKAALEFLDNVDDIINNFSPEDIFA